MRKVELVRTSAWEKGWEHLFHSIGLDTRRMKGETETKDHLKKDCGEGEK